VAAAAGHLLVDTPPVGPLMVELQEVVVLDQWWVLLHR